MRSYVCQSTREGCTVRSNASWVMVKRDPPPPCTPQTWDLRTPHNPDPPTNMRPQSHAPPGLWPQPYPASDIWWPSLETCSNLFTSGAPQHLVVKHVRFPQAGGSMYPTRMHFCSFSYYTFNNSFTNYISFTCQQNKNVYIW